jgi:hypothetical protein
MVIPAGIPDPVPHRIALDRAEIQIDASQLRRTARFTDGSIRAIAMNWADVKRVVAFRRDVLTSAVVSVAVTDKANVVVLDEQMNGWPTLIESLPAHITLATTFAEWLDQTTGEPLASHWTILYQTQP